MRSLQPFGSAVRSMGIVPGDATRTYLFSDVEGSTRLWERHPDAMQGALARHDDILRAAVECCGGTVVKTTGDGLMAVFGSALDAINASLAAQEGLRDEPWGETGPLRVRMGTHVGEAQTRGDDYYGTAVNRAARVMAAAHGGQVLLSAPIAELVAASLPDDVHLRDLGTHRLKDLAGPEHLFQLVRPGLPETFPPLATVDVRPNNLPTQTSAFIGREALLDELRAQLDAAYARLVTLTGPGGTGKTRLALQAAAEQVDRFEDGVYFVDLSAERQTDGAYAAIVRIVAIASSGDDPPLEVLKRGLRERQLLLVLDNFEQVVDAATGLAELLAHCPGLTALVTSRMALRVRGERLFPVPPLTLPAGAGAVLLEEALAAESVQLFVERATSLRPDFKLTEENAADVVATCSRLDGLPLAIELAAARITLFTVDELRSRLDGRLDVLQGGGRDLPARQRTLRSTIEWSTELLTQAQRRVLQLFSVFVGARLTDVEGTARRLADNIEVLENISTLVDDSLVRNMPDEQGHQRLAMLETIRSYAAEQLDTDPDFADAVRRAHAEHYTELAVWLREQLAQTDREQALDALEVELGNLRAAWSHLVQQGDVVRLNDLLEPLWGYYDARGAYGAAMELGDDLLKVLASQPETPQRSRDEIALEMSLARALIVVRGYDAEVERSIRAAVERSREQDDAPERFPVLRSLATLHIMRSDFDSALEIGRELLAIAERQRDPMLLSDAHLVYGMNTAFLGDVDDGLRHIDTAIQHFDTGAAGLVKFRIGPSPGVVANVVSGLLLWEVGFPDRAVARLERSVTVADEIGHPYSRAYAIWHAALLDLWRFDLSAMAARAEALHALATAHDYPIWRALAVVLRGTKMIADGEVEDGLAEVDRGFDLYDDQMTPPMFWPPLLQVRAAGRMLAGRIDQALALIVQSESLIPATDQQAPQLAIMRGDLHMAMAAPDAATAEASYQSAFDVAHERGLRMAELQAATRLASLHRGTSREQASLQQLRDVYNSFTEGHDTVQLVAARTVLDAPTV
jgi:predicted ATPase/class 3 adenylate cyclase